MHASFTRATSAAMCAVLVACAGSPAPAPSTSVRTRPPQGYEKTITSYFAFRIRGPRKNAEIIVDKPEPGDCPLDGDLSSRRGWAVPVVYATRAGGATGTVQIHTRQYFFWFLGDTIAGITPRLEQCPGLAAMTFEDAREAEAVEALSVAAATALSPRPGSGGERLDAAEPSRGGRARDRARAIADRRQATAYAAKKAGAPSGKARTAAKTASRCVAGRCTHDRATSADLDGMASRLR